MTINSREINFFEPQWLLLLLAAPLLVIVNIKYLRNRTPLMVLNTKVVYNGKHKLNFSPPDYLLIIRIAAIITIILSLAKPQIVISTRVKSPASATAMVLALDLSKSMLIEDIKPNRLEALKDVLNQFITMRANDKIGVVLYAGESMNWCPLTTNYPFLIDRVNKMAENNLNDGTAIGAGLTSAINVLKQCTLKNKVVILLTDGENNAGIIDPVMAAKFARRLGIKVYAIGIGSSGPALMPLIGIDGKKYYQKIYVKMNDAELEKISTMTGGAYFKANDATALQKVYVLINKSETKNVKWIVTKNYSSCFSWCIYATLLLLFLEVFLRFTLLRTLPA